MATATIRTGKVDDFFCRAREAASRADRGEPFEGKVTISFEDPDQMLMLLSGGRRRIMMEVIKKTTNRPKPGQYSKPKSVNHCQRNTIFGTKRPVVSKEGAG